MLDSPIAFICVYNENDVLPWTVRHLTRQGCRVHIIDNWSTDGSYELAFGWCSGFLPYAEKRLVTAELWPMVTAELWPKEGPLPIYNWSGLLNHVAKLAAASDARWIIHHDADEIRRTPWPGVTLAEGFKRVEAEGYNCVDHQLYLFPPVDNGYCSDRDLEHYFTRYTLNALDCRLPQQKAWMNVCEVDLAGSGGGHTVRFPGRMVYPVKWISKHYPIRSQAHGERKIFRERRPRYSPAEKARGWHIQYDHIKPGHNFLWDPAALKDWGGDVTSGTPKGTKRN